MPRSPHIRSHDGFALLITITLVAFLVLVLVSLATLTRVETAVAQNSQTGEQARQNALLGLNIALGQLQRHAGPDQRVTARADITGTPLQPNLTGVWNTTATTTLSPSAPATWLLSGNEGANPLVVTPDKLDPAAPAADDEVFLVDRGSVSTDAMRIKAPIQLLAATDLPGFSAAPVNIGGYAWWIGDEGVKARAALDDPHSTADANERIYSFIGTQRPDIRQTIAQYPADSTRLTSLLSLEQMPMAASTAATQAMLAAAAADHFHDITTHSASVLADTASGGLKKDLTAWLSHTGSLPAGAPADTDPIIASADGGTDFMMPDWGIIRSWHSIRNTPGLAIGPTPQTQTAQGVYPVITYFRLGIAVSQGEAAEPLRPFRVHLFPTLVLWNPTNTAIEGAYEFCFLIRREGTPGRYITFTFTGTGTTKTLDHRLWRLLDGPARTIPYLRFAIESTRIEPGESRVFTLRDADDGNEYDPDTPGTQTLASAFNVSNSVVISSSAPLTAAERDSPVQWSTVEGTELDMVLRQAGLHAPAPSGSNWNVFQDGAYQTVQRPGFGNATLMPSPAVNPTAFATQFYWHATARLSGSANTPRWIAQLNARAPFITTTGAENSLPNFVAGTARGSGGLSFPDAPLASNGQSVTGSAVNLALTEFLPAGIPLFSLAQLQHANLTLLGNQPIYAVGNSLADFHTPSDRTSFSANVTGSTPALASSITTAHDMSYLLNEALWDRYFLSTIPDDITAADLGDSTYVLPNARMRFHDTSAATPLSQIRGRDAFATAAASLMLEGGFNINSTSVDAWSALLAGRNGLLYDPAASAESSTPLAYPYSRFTRPSAKINGDWSGYRQLTSDQINRLAHNIVTEIKARGPFRSLADFINRRIQTLDTNSGVDDDPALKGTIQAAIDRSDQETPSLAPINTHPTFNATPVDLANVRPSAVTGIPASDFEKLVKGGTSTDAIYSDRSAFAPGYLTQADILTAIGPLLTARSDTFRIRAYGQTKNPATGEVTGRAWCEAIVQRTARYVDDSLPETDTPTPGDLNDRFGRRFEIVSFRWLTPADL